MPHLEVFFTTPDLVDSKAATLRIVGQEAHHLTHVLRHKPGDRLVVVDGIGCAHWVVLVTVERAEAIASIERQQTMWGEPKVPLGLIIPPLRGTRLDWVAEKGTELGVGWFLIPRTRNSLAQAGASKLDRWKRIALSAMKQCGRSVLPSVESFPDLESALTASRDLHTPSGQIFSRSGILYARMGASEIGKNSDVKGKIRTAAWDAILVTVGPEGDFSEEEHQLLRDAGATPFGLGSRRLRSDTAAVAALAQLNGVLNNP